MSNDGKLWLMRFVFFGCVLVDVLVLFHAMSLGWSADPAMKTWFGVFFVLIVLTFPSAWFYHMQKSRRWDDIEHKSQSQIDVETLAALGAEAKQERDERKDGEGMGHS